MFYKNRFYDPAKLHHAPRGFRNKEHFSIKLRAVQRWEFERIKARQPYAPENGYTDFYQRWGQNADFTLPGDRIWWLGHASTLIRLGNKYILTDPVFSNRVSPFKFAGPKRCMPLPMQFEQLPVIDVILISHSHYDHLDKQTMKRLIARFPKVTVLVPLGLKKAIQSWGAQHVVELDWWDSYDLDGNRFHCVPARHWSQRQAIDRNMTLWCGWVASRSDINFYFMGDTSYSRILHEIAERFPISMAAIPIGCYSPRWFMQDQHIDPQQAVQLFRELHCQHAIAVHWATFELSSEALDEPPVLFREALQAQDVAPEKFELIKVGASIPIIAHSDNTSSNK